MKKLTVLLLGLFCFASVFAAKARIGISMPTTELQRWTTEGEILRKKLILKGFDVDLQYAENDVSLQISQIEKMIKDKCNVLLVNAIEAGTLKRPLDAAKKKKITVISYDRLLMNTDAVSYYVTFDNYMVGKLQGKYLKDKLKLETRSVSKPVYMEIFTGDLGDNNVNFYWEGAMDILKPYIDLGIIIVPSGELSKNECSIKNWSTDLSKERMIKLISKNSYGPSEKKLDAVLCANDSTANGITEALILGGYNSSNFPLLTGQDCEVTSVKNIISGTQAMSVFKDSRKLIDVTVTMVEDICSGKAPEINDRKTYWNGTGYIPSYLCEPDSIDTANYRSLVDSGFYKADEIF